MTMEPFEAEASAVRSAEETGVLAMVVGVKGRAINGCAKEEAKACERGDERAKIGDGRVVGLSDMRHRRACYWRRLARERVVYVRLRCPVMICLAGGK